MVGAVAPGVARGVDLHAVGGVAVGIEAVEVVERRVVVGVGRPEGNGAARFGGHPGVAGNSRDHGGIERVDVNHRPDDSHCALTGKEVAGHLVSGCENPFVAVPILDGQRDRVKGDYLLTALLRKRHGDRIPGEVQHLEVVRHRRAGAGLPNLGIGDQVDSRRHAVLDGDVVNVHPRAGH